LPQQEWPHKADDLEPLKRAFDISEKQLESIQLLKVLRANANCALEVFTTASANDIGDAELRMSFSACAWSW
jgi:hypothetical protein